MTSPRHESASQAEAGEAIAGEEAPGEGLARIRG